MRGVGVRNERKPSRFAGASTIAFAAFLIGAQALAASEFPAQRPANRIQAATVLAGGGPTRLTCLTPILQSARLDPKATTMSARRAAISLLSDLPLPSESRIVAPSGDSVRFTLDRGSLDRLDATDDDRDGRPDLAQAALQGLAEARVLLRSRFDLADPGTLEVLLARLGGGVDGVFLPAAGREGRSIIVVDPHGRGDTGAVRRATAHQFAHAVAQAYGAGLSTAWGESLATWTSLRAGGDERALNALATRFGSLHAGIAEDGPDSGAGGAAWLAFVEEAYGETALRLTVEEISQSTSLLSALDRAMRRAAGVPFPDAFREFHVWSVLTGDRDDRRHFSFASKLPSPTFIETAEGLPALSLHSDPPVEGLGAAAVLLRPELTSGGLRLRFDGEASGPWQADLLLERRDGTRHRVRVPLDDFGGGEALVPATEIAAAVLLVRNLDAEDRTARRFTWSATWEPAYPVELQGVAAHRTAEGAVVVEWESRSEMDALGFNVLRSEGLLEPRRINAVWIPAIGDASTPAGYRFFDRTAAAGRAYTYRVEAVTSLGLTVRSESVPLP